MVEAADSIRGRQHGLATTVAGTSLSEAAEPTELGCVTFRFLVACVCCAIDPSARTRLAAIDVSSVDWDLLRRLARENRVDVLLLHGMRQGPLHAIPPDVIASLEAYEVDNRHRNAASLVVLDSILGELARRATSCLLFKGPVLAQQAYPDAGMRCASFSLARNPGCALSSRSSTRGPRTWSDSTSATRLPISC